MDNCTRCLSCWKSTHTYICFRHMTWTPKLPLCSKTILYLPVFSLVGLGGGGGGFGDITCDLAQLPVLWGGPPPTPSPLSQLPRQKLWSLISCLKKQGWGGGGEGWFLGQKHTNLKPLEKQRYLEWGSIVSPNLSMGDRIHEQRSMEPPRCPGRRKKPCHGFYTILILQKPFSDMN